MSNRIVAENARTDGVAPKSYWDVPHSTQIEGFARDFSVNAGNKIDFSVNVNGGAGSDYTVEIFRLGYYGGNGAREVASWTNTNATVQAEALYDATRGMVDAGNWSVTDSWNIPADAVSGVYLARVQRLDAAGNPIAGAVNQIPFVVRNDGVAADVVLQTSDTTWQAYNGWAGNNGDVGANLYGDPSDRVVHPVIPTAGPNALDRAYAVSYNRPFITRDGTSTLAGPQDYLFGADYAAISWLEENGYDVSYISGVDTDRLGADYLTKYKAFISVGHDEYWSGGQRENVEAARDAGVNLLFWGGNDMYWKTRWETAISADGKEYRTLVCYKETFANYDPNAAPQDYADLDPTDIWTGTWRDTRFHDSVDANGRSNAGGEVVDPLTGLVHTCNCIEQMLTGQLFGPDGTGEFGGALDVPQTYAGLRIWRGTSVANTGAQDLAPGIIGYEWNVSPDDANRPAGLVKLSETTLPWTQILVDQGNRTQAGSATHTLSLYRDDSGALVFGAGTVFWSWALSNMHDSSPYGANIENRQIQQMMVNLFADMGIQPGVLDSVLATSGLVRAAASTDVTAADANILGLPTTVTQGSTVTIGGTATDIDGVAATTDGVVAVVEVSVDGGTTWRVASTTDNWAHWTYSWKPAATGTYTIKARAIDDSLNVWNATPDTETVVVTTPPKPADVTLFDGDAATNVVSYNDNATVNLGMRFSVSEGGAVEALRYWRAAGDAGDTDVRTGHLWNGNGTLMGTVTFTSTAGQSGWQTATLATPVTLVAGQTYVVSYQTANNYVSTNGFFVAANEAGFDGRDDGAFGDLWGIIKAPEGNAGVYAYGTTAQMPTQSYQSSNYWVDVVFAPASTNTTPNTPPVLPAQSFTAAENQVVVGTVQATDADGNPLTYAIAGGADAALFSINAATGALAFKAAPNFEAPGDVGGNNVYDVILGVTDGKSAAVTRATTVTVTNVNEAPTALALSAATVAENAAAGQVVGTLAGTDPDAGAALTYSLVDSAGGRFAISGNQLVVAAGAALNREAAASHTVTVRVTDAGGLSFDRQFTIALNDVDEFDVTPPSDANAAANQVTEGAAAGTLVGITAAALDADATTNGVTYSLTDNAGGRFAIDAATGVVSVASGAVLAAGTQQITVRATSADGSIASTNFQIAVAAATAARVTVNLTNAADTYTATDGRSYSVQGLAGNDVITLGAGSDIVNGGAGNDIISTGGGNDIIEVTGTSAGLDAFDGGAGTDLVRATAAGTAIRFSAIAGIEEISANGFTGVKIIANSTADSFDLSGTVLTGIVSIDLGSGNDSLLGSAGADTILGGAGVDTIAGGAGADVIDGGTSDDILSGGADDDTFLIGASGGSDSIDGGTGTDSVVVSAALSIQFAKLSNVESLTATASGVTLVGTTGADVMSQSALNWSGLSLVDGGAGNDTITGGAGADRIAGRAGTDLLAGGAGADTFVYFTASDSRTTTVDTIGDFVRGQDQLDLSAIDANTSSLVPGDQAFSFIGTAAFSRVAGQLRYDLGSASSPTVVTVDTNGDARADMEIRLTGAHALASGDFIL
ncbi:N,N-dimethylformamidase beta subunit family domain-containing protein [Rubellimicrobium aerolatum]|uniref:N,N-dimethylformamidase beta subunit family domain-containing protein n=1 Tax=Rubellimicrobium aerolatum TaxID=490979 RepID=A0ABW0SE58_9RHOB|nr:N,N-dimethylformamidase beta subunit family domain-containing protein [Rubellimicrobium aerolatum]MBP1807042.1 Ca2+-binding RTX toxin-like protein [Rubellimicrobium aerolatum]